MSAFHWLYIPMTSAQASDEHPMSTRWASDGIRWLEGGNKMDIRNELLKW